MTFPPAKLDTAGGTIFRIGRAEDRESLQALQLRSSTESSPHRESILGDSASTALAPELLEMGRVEMAEIHRLAVGFVVLLSPEDLIAELDGLFVEPAWWRLGIGSALLRRAVHRRATRARFTST